MILGKRTLVINLGKTFNTLDIQIIPHLVSFVANASNILSINPMTSKLTRLLIRLETKLEKGLNPSAKNM